MRRAPSWRPLLIPAASGRELHRYLEVARINIDRENATVPATRPHDGDAEEHALRHVRPGEPELSAGDASEIEPVTDRVQTG